MTPRVLCVLALGAALCGCRSEPASSDVTAGAGSAPALRCVVDERGPEPEATPLPLVWDHAIACTNSGPRGQLRVTSQISNGADGPTVLLEGVAITKITPPPIAKAWREALGEPGALTLQPAPPIVVPPGKTVAFTVSGPYVADHDPGAKRKRQVNFHMSLLGRVEGARETFALPMNGHITTGAERQVGPRPARPGEADLGAP